MTMHDPDANVDLAEELRRLDQNEAAQHELELLGDDNEYSREEDTDE